MRILFLNRYGSLGASSRMRTIQFIPFLSNRGVDCVVNPLTDDEALSQRYAGGRYPKWMLIYCYVKRIAWMLKRRQFDLVRIEKEALPWFPVWFESLLLRGVPYVLDYDDATFHRYDEHRSTAVRRVFGARLDKLMACSRLVIAGNEYLAKRARSAGAPWVEIIPTVIDLDKYVLNQRDFSAKSTLKIVWIGSPSTVQYLDMLKGPLSDLAKSHDFIFRVIAGSAVDFPGVRTEFVQWSEKNEVQAIQECDIGVMPLYDMPFERGKCGYKLIQYMGCALPVVASPVGVNRDIVGQDGVGFLADSTGEWVDSLGRLLCDAELRKKMGSAGRNKVERSYSLQAVGPRLLELFSRAASSSGS